MSIPTSVTPLRLGIIGGGNVLGAYRTAIARLRERGLARVHQVCARDHQRESVLAQLGPSGFTTEAQEVIHGDADVILILTSMKEHGWLARGALQAGKHVLVEKPLATTWDEVTELVELSRRSRGHLVCAPFTTLSPTFQALGARLQRGDIGMPCLARARYGWAGPWWNEWFYQPGGGCLLDLGVYCFTSLTGLLGPVRRVTALTGVAIPEREINSRKVRVEAEDNAQVLLEFSSGTLAAVTSGFTMQQYRCPALEVYGTTGTLQMLGDDWNPSGFELWQNSAGCWQVFPETAPEWPWTDGLRELVEAIHEGRSPNLVPEHARHVLEIIFKAQQSGRVGQALDLESTFSPPSFTTVVAAAAHQQHDRTREH